MIKCFRIFKGDEMARRRKTSMGMLPMIGLILIAAGVAGAAYGGINYMNLQDAVGNRVVKALGGTTEAEKQALIFLIGGAAALILGLGVFFKGRR